LDGREGGVEGEHRQLSMGAGVVQTLVSDLAAGVLDLLLTREED